MIIFKTRLFSIFLFHISYQQTKVINIQRITCKLIPVAMARSLKIWKKLEILKSDQYLH